MAKQHPVAWLDADILLHRAVSFCKDTDFDGEVMIGAKQAIWHFNNLLKSWLKQVGKTEDYFLVISNGKNFRHNLYPDYKANRKDIVPHPSFAELKEEVKSYVATVWEDGIEADDLIGIRTTEFPNSVAVSADKDFATVPCRLYIPASHGNEGSWHSFTEDEANYNWLIQTMTGDTVDNYKGIPKCGPVKARQVLPYPTKLENMWLAVETAFKAKGLSADYCLTMARLARILRHTEYNFDTKEVTLWTPEPRLISTTLTPEPTSEPSL